MFFHLLAESAYTYKYNKLISDYFDISEHHFLIFGKSTWDSNENYEFKNSTNVNQYNKIELLQLLESSDGIIIHGLFSRHIVDLFYENQQLLKKTNWVIWGGDLYFYREVKTGVITKELEYKRKTIINQLCFISCEVEGDFYLAQKIYSTKAQYFCAGYPFLLDFDYLKQLKGIKQDDTETHILLGNSATKTNNHIEALESISKYQDQNLKIFTSLAYGNKEYAKNVIKCGKTLFGDKFVPLNNFIPYQKYMELVATINIGIMNHDRQQGLGSILSLLFLGKKIFMRNNVTTTDYLKKVGLKVYNLNDIKTLDFNDFIKYENTLSDENEKKILKLHSVDNWVKRWDKVFRGMKENKTTENKSLSKYSASDIKLKIAIIDSSNTTYAQPKLIYDELVKLGHDVLWLARPNNEGYKKTKVPEGYISICIANNLSPIDIFTDSQMQLSHPPLERAYKSNADFIFVGDKTIYNRFFKHRRNAFYMPYAVSTNIFRPLNEEAIYDVGFIGNLRIEERKRRIKLIQKHFKCYISSNDFLDDANKMLNKCKIIFNTSDGKEINMRVFEALAAEKPLVTEKVDYLDELFKDQKHLLLYENDDEIVEKISSLLNDEEKRKYISKNGLSEIKQKHTYQHRAMFIVDRITKEKLSMFNNKTNSPMKILLTNHQLLDYGGSEIFTYTIANYLKKYGHDVTVYTKFADKITYLFDEINVKVYDKIEQIKGEKFDVAHVHHNLMALDIRYHFPNLPIVFLSHGVTPFLEQPPVIDINISKYLAVSEEVKSNIISKGIDKNKTEIFRNVIDHTKFFPKRQINEKPKNALIISNKMNNEVEEIIKKACNKLNIKTRFIGRGFEEIKPNELPYCINEADIVFSLGRGVMEAILCGRIPIVYDRNGGDGIVNSENIYELMKKNFSGRSKNKMFSVDELVDEINKYDSNDSKKLYEIGFNLFNADNVKNIEIKYKSAIDNFEKKELSIENEKIVETIFNSNEVTSRYTKVLHNSNYLRTQKYRDAQQHELEKNLITISEELINSGKNSEAITLLEYTLNRVNEKSFDAANNLAVAWILENKFEEAEDLLNGILLTNPENEIAQENLLFIQNNKVEAIL